jgi:hypothetical protein
VHQFGGILSKRLACPRCEKLDQRQQRSTRWRRIPSTPFDFEIALQHIGKWFERGEIIAQPLTAPQLPQQSLCPTTRQKLRQLFRSLYFLAVPRFP